MNNNLLHAFEKIAVNGMASRAAEVDAFIKEKIIKELNTNDQLIISEISQVIENCLDCFLAPNLQVQQVEISVHNEKDVKEVSARVLKDILECLIPNNDGTTDGIVAAINATILSKNNVAIQTDLLPMVQDPSCLEMKSCSR